MKAIGETSTTPYTPPKTAKPSKTRSRLPRPSGFQTQKMWMGGPKRSGTYAAYLSWWRRHQAAQAKTAKPGRGKGGGGGGGSTTPPVSTSDTGLGPRTADDLRTLAESQVDSELAGQINPLEHDIGTTQQREAAAAAELNRMFGELGPQMNDSLRIVAQNWDRTREAQQGLFAQAGQRLNQVKQDAANEAQALAQQIGGPVAVDQFTGQVDAASLGAEDQFAGQQMHSMGIGNVGVQELGDWTGKVFPLVRTEKQLGVRQKYEEEISKIRDQITTLKGQRGGLVNARLNELLGKEREYQLALAQSKLEKTKAAHDWAATVHTLKNDDARLALAGYQARTGVALKRGELAFKKMKLTADQKAMARKLGISEATLKERIRHNTETEANARARVSVQREKNALQRAKAMANPTSLKPITLTKKVYLRPDQEAGATLGRIKAFWDPKKKKWYQYAKQTITMQEWARRHMPNGTTDPKVAYKALIRLGAPPAVARNAVIQQFHVDPVKKKK